MQVIKIEPGEYKVIKGNGEEYLVSKDSYTGDWGIYYDKKYITFAKTKKECLELIEKGQSVRIAESISLVPPIKLSSHFKQKSKPNRLWQVDDIIYSTKEGKWKIIGSYFNNSFDSEDLHWWDYENFEEECEIE